MFASLHCRQFSFCRDLNQFLPVPYICDTFALTTDCHNMIRLYNSHFLLRFQTETTNSETQDEAQRLRLPGPSVSPQEDPQQQLPDATQLRSYMHHVTVPASNYVTGTSRRQGRDSAPGRIVRKEELPKQYF
jgi:hypothetical protein